MNKILLIHFLNHFQIWPFLFDSYACTHIFRMALIKVNMPSRIPSLQVHVILHILPCYYMSFVTIILHAYGIFCLVSGP